MVERKKLSKPVQRLVDQVDAKVAAGILARLTMIGVMPTPQTGAIMALNAAVLLERNATKAQFIELCEHAWDEVVADTEETKRGLS